MKYGDEQKNRKKIIPLTLRKKNYYIVWLKIVLSIFTGFDVTLYDICENR